MSVDEFNKIIGRHPEIKITSFMAIKNAILFAPKPPVKFGEVKDRISVELSSDELKAYIRLCVKNGSFPGMQGKAHGGDIKEPGKSRSCIWN